MSTSSPGITRIGQVAVVVHDLPRAVAFYRDVLGLRFLFEAPPGLAFFDCGGTRIMLTPPEGPDERQYSSILYYEVPDIQAAAETLRARGAVFEQDPHVVARLGQVELWMGFLRDPDGNALAVMSEVPV
jgi:methylmalonyl-CoA/ethylmalonyl-CoA epimerase